MKKCTSFYVILIASIVGIVLNSNVVSAKGVTSVKEIVILGAIQQAENFLKKAAHVGSEWRDTEKMIKLAKEALATGDFIAARHLADEATYQGELGYQQGIKQKRLEFPDYLQ